MYIKKGGVIKKNTFNKFSILTNMTNTMFVIYLFTYICFLKTFIYEENIYCCHCERIVVYNVI